MPFLPIIRRSALAGVLAIVVVLGVLGVTASSAPTCDTSWGGAGSGNWATAGNWTNGVPDGTKTACIVVDGTYEVTISGSQAAKGLTLGGASGTQTVKLVGSTTDGQAKLQLVNQSGGSTGIGSHGVLRLETTAADQNAYLEIVAGTLLNAGTIRSEPRPNSDPGVNLIYGDVSSGGTIAINGNTDAGADPDWTTSGALNIATGATLRVVGGVGTFTQTGGTVTNQGTFQETGGSAVFSAGTATGNPLELVSVAISPSGSGSATLAPYGSATLASNVAAGYTLLLDGKASLGAGQLTVNQSRTNDGTIRLKSQAAGQLGYLVVAAGTLTNTGLIETLPRGGGDTGNELIYGDVDNQDTITIGGNTLVSQDPDWTTSGAVTIAQGKKLYFTGACCSETPSFTQTGGSIDSVGIYHQQTGTAVFSGGSASGNPLHLQTVDVRPSGIGTAVLAVHDSSILGSNIAAGYTVLLQGNPSFGTGSLRVLQNRTNNGTMRLESTTGSQYGYLNIEAGTLTNTGTLQTLPRAQGDLGPEFVYGDLDNQGTLSLGGNTLTSADPDWANSGTVTIAQNATAGGPSTTLVQNAGTTTLQGPAAKLTAATILQGGTLGGAGTIDGNLVNHGQVAPGSSPGTLNVTGDYTQTGLLSIEVSDAGHDLLAVSGAATLGGTLALTTTGAHAAGDTFQILTAGTRTGTFSAVTGADSGPYQVNYSPTAATLEVLPSSPPVGTTTTPPTTTTAPTVTPTDRTPQVVRIAAINARGKKLVVTVGCPASEQEPCAGTLTLTYKKVGLGKASFRIAAGRAATISVSPSPKARRAIARLRRLKVKVVARTRDGAGNTGVITKTLALRRR